VHAVFPGAIRPVLGRHKQGIAAYVLHACCALLQTTGLPAPLAGDNAIPIKGSAVPNKDVRTLLRPAFLLYHQLDLNTKRGHVHFRHGMRY